MFFVDLPSELPAACQLRSIVPCRVLLDMPMDKAQQLMKQLSIPMELMGEVQQGLSISLSIDALEMENGQSEHASLNPKQEKRTGTTMTDSGDQSDPRPSPRTLQNRLHNRGNQMARPIIEKIMENRYQMTMRRLARTLQKDGDDKNAALIAALADSDEAVEMFRQESSVAYAQAQGIAVESYTTESRPFLDFLERMTQGQVFRKFVEWVFDNKDKIIEIAKMIAAIIGIFA